MEGRSPVLIDFGLARVAEDPRLTQTGWLLGTPGYLAPEILYGDDATVASDVHAWAATVVFAATGRPPYGKGPAMAIMDRVRRGEHDLSGVPEPLGRVLRECLDPEPLERPDRARAARLDPRAAPACAPRRPGCARTRALDACRSRRRTSRTSPRRPSDGAARPARSEAAVWVDEPPDAVRPDRSGARTRATRPCRPRRILPAAAPRPDPPRPDQPCRCSTRRPREAAGPSVVLQLVGLGALTERAGRLRAVRRNRVRRARSSCCSAPPPSPASGTVGVGWSADGPGGTTCRRPRSPLPGYLLLAFLGALIAVAVAGLCGAGDVLAGLPAGPARRHRAGDGGARVRARPVVGAGVRPVARDDPRAGRPGPPARSSAAGSWWRCALLGTAVLLGLLFSGGPNWAPALAAPWS